MLKWATLSMRPASARAMSTAQIRFSNVTHCITEAGSRGTIEEAAARLWDTSSNVMPACSVLLLFDTRFKSMKKSYYSAPNERLWLNHYNMGSSKGLLTNSVTALKAF